MPRLRSRSCASVCRSAACRSGPSIPRPVEPAGGKTVRQLILIKQGIEIETAKKMVKAIKDAKIKAQASIQGDELRVLGQEPRRLADGHRSASEGRLRPRSPVRELPRLRHGGKPVPPARKRATADRGRYNRGVPQRGSFARRGRGWRALALASVAGACHRRPAPAPAPPPAAPAAPAPPAHPPIPSRPAARPSRGGADLRLCRRGRRGSTRLNGRARRGFSTSTSATTGRRSSCKTAMGREREAEQISAHLRGAGQ